jgi:hypothetical protein
MGQGTIVVHSHVEQRYRCHTCGHTFAATTGTPFYRVHTAADVVTIVRTVLCHGCPSQALVAAFGLDERPVAAWVTRAGRHCQQGHQHVVQQGQVDRPPVQPDERWVKLVGRRVWMAMALAVPSRLWLGGCVRPQRDRGLLTTLVQMVRSCARSLAIRVCVDGWASAVTAFLHVLRPRAHGRPRAATAGAGAGGAPGPGGQAVRPAARRERGAAGGARDRRGHRGGAGSNRPRHGDQYRVHRATQRHLSHCPDASGVPGTRDGPYRGDPERRHGAGRGCLELLRGAWESARGRSGRRRWPPG